MATRRAASRQQPRPKAAATTPTPKGKPGPPSLPAPAQAQAASEAVAALLDDARRQADGILADAEAQADGIVRHAHERHAVTAEQARREGDELTSAATAEAATLLAEADRRARQIREAAQGWGDERRAQAELAATTATKSAQETASQIMARAGANADGIVQQARRASAQTEVNAKEQAERVLGAARTEAERLMTDANRYAEARMGQAMANARELQQQAVADVAAGRVFREEGEALKAVAVELHVAAERKLADAATRTAKRIHRRELKASSKTDRKRGRPAEADGMQLTAVHRLLIALIILGAALIAAIGFTGSYGAVRDLAREKGFGAFADVLPIGVDAGIGVLLALDLLLTWLRMPLPMLRHAAWVMTGATVWFNAAASWPDPLGVGLHMAMPDLFVIVVEAARHAIGRIADVEAKEHTQTPKLIRWTLAFRSTWRMWRRQHVWSVRDLNAALDDEGQRLVYIRSLQTKYKIRSARTRKSKGWRQLATEIELMPLDLYETGVAFPEALQRAQRAATGDPVAGAAGRPEKRHGKPATKTPQGAPATRHEDATKTATAAPRGASKKTNKKRHGGATRTEAKAALRALYDSLGARPKEGELVDELKRIGSAFDSRQYANKLRVEIETDEPHLVALGSENVRPLTG